MTAQTSGPGSAPVDAVGAASGSEPTMSGPELTVNVPLLRKAVEWAEAEAAKPAGAWAQDAYILTGQDASCGTSYCLAGWTLHAAGWSDAAILAESLPDQPAAELLGIPEWEGDTTAGSHLFADDNTIEDVRRIAEDIAGERL